MKHAHNASSILSILVFGMGLSASSFAQYGDNLELTTSGDGNSGGNLGSYSLANIMPMSMVYNSKNKFEHTDRAAKIDPKRQEVINLMQSSFDLANGKKYEEALAKLQLLEAAEGKTAEEVFFVHRMRISIASTSGNDALLVNSLESAIASGQAPAEEQLQFIRALSNLYAKQKDIPKTIIWTSRYLKEAGNDADMRTRLIRAYYLNNEFFTAARELRANIAADEAAGRKPTQQDIRLLTSTELKAGNQAGYTSAIEKSVVYYPRKEDWAELLNNVLSKPGFQEDLGLDVYRLMFKTNQFNAPNDFMDMAQMALQSGFPAEAKQVLTQGFRLGILGKGPGAASHKKLLDLVTKRVASKPKALLKEEAQVRKDRDGSALEHIGYTYVTDGQLDKGIKLIEQGIAMGGMKRPEHAKLHLGIALGTAGRTAEAIQTLKAVQGTDGASDLARYWAIQFAQPNT